MHPTNRPRFLCSLLSMLALAVTGCDLLSQEPIARVILSPPAVKAVAPNQEIEAITTERPSAGFSPDVIPAGSIQMENGVNVSTQRHGVIADGPESLIRFGVLHHLELRVLTNNAMYQTSNPPGVSGMQRQDPGISTKILISKANSFAPKSAIVSLSMPLGSSNLTSGSYDPGVTAIWTQSFPHGFSANEVGQVTLTTLEGVRLPLWAPSVVVGRSLSDRLSLYSEYAPSMESYVPFSYIVDGGFAYLPAKTRQIDVRVGYAKDTAGTHYLLSVGYSIRHLRGPSLSHTY